MREGGRERRVEGGTKGRGEVRTRIIREREKE